MFLFDSNQPLLISGPCSLENEDLVFKVASHLKKVTNSLSVSFVFKVSFDKANRTSLRSFRGPGLKKSLEVFRRLKDSIEISIITDIHETYQADLVSDVVDVVQIPSFLCRQTDLLLAAGKTQLPVNIKKGQFVSPRAMKYSVEKVQSTGNNQVFVTERGTSFGHGDLVVDYRGIVEMRQYCPVVFDAGHSTQQPADGNPQTNGQREFIAPLARAASAVGIDGLFVETHPDPDSALCDGGSMLPLDEVEPLLREVLAISRSREESRYLRES